MILLIPLGISKIGRFLLDFFSLQIPEEQAKMQKCSFLHLDLHARVTGEEEEFNKELPA